ncbi:TonB-dependent receptor [Sphingomonas sp.]|uniref:TonB-dependent receptor domain-containing protein n=1 Tax=Sphingomonas sp. TaxID=28214 RepID=UPI000DB858C4|nr:TonB-dependent receptor [Sphingomonas sp.]PZU06891.1 MAG: TonB-dependent receptor [Sphingomonas sp.]
MRRTDAIAAAGLALILAAPGAAASGEVRFAVPPSSLDAALAMFAQQSGIDVGAAGAGIARLRSPGVRGHMGAGRALDRLLDGTGLIATPIAGGGFRLVPEPPRRTHSKAAILPVVATGDIIVTANKRGTSLLRYPGSISIVDRAYTAQSVAGDRGLVEAMAEAPTLQSTALGAGRDKLFIRGIADSSFMGPTQATTSVYFGEVQLAYNGPDPNLKLYDVDRVEVLEGPQGTLYGAGAIGGVIRITPREPDAKKMAASVTASVAAGQGSDLGNGLAGMLNVPILSDRIALRGVAYRYRDGGYIDDSYRDLHNINDTKTRGARLALALTPGDGWSINLGGVAQSIDAADSQYASRSMKPLTRRSAIAQPFEDDFYLGRLTVTKRWDNGLTLLSATGIIHSKVDDRFDASIVPTLPIAYDTHNRNGQFTQELRLTRPDGPHGGWIIGASWLHDRDEIAREYGNPNETRSIVGVTNRVHSAALFGEATLPLTTRLSITGGARLTYARIDSNPSIVTRGSSFVRGQSQTRVDPVIGWSWQIVPRLAWYGRYAEGFRTGGLSVAQGVGRIANFKSDSIGVAETGLRLAKASARGLGGTIAISKASWRHIQADLVNSRGFPFTANVGNGRITGVEGTFDWSPVERLQVNGGFFFADNRGFDRPDLPPNIRVTRLPDTPRFSAAGGFGYDIPLAGGAGNVAVTGRYVGPSYLDPVALLNLRQGGYATFDLKGAWRRDRVRIDVGIDNIANAGGDRFALGNPFGVASGDQYTPVRPRTLRLAVTRDW